MPPLEDHTRSIVLSQLVRVVIPGTFTSRIGRRLDAWVSLLSVRSSPTLKHDSQEDDNSHRTGLRYASRALVLYQRFICPSCNIEHFQPWNLRLVSEGIYRMFVPYLQYCVT